MTEAVYVVEPDAGRDPCPVDTHPSDVPSHPSEAFS